MLRLLANCAHNEKPFDQQTLWLVFLVLCHIFLSTGVVGSSVYFFQVLSPESLRYTYETRLARNFGVGFSAFYKEVHLAFAVPSHSCSSLQNLLDVKGAVVLVERGGCSFLSKTVQAESSGAYAVIITDTEDTGDTMVEMVADDTGRKAHIPALYLPGSHGRILRKHFLYSEAPVIINIPLNLTNTLLHHVRKPPWELW